MVVGSIALSRVEERYLLGIGMFDNETTLVGVLVGQSHALLIAIDNPR
jgi:hypothetical protein